FRQLREDLPLLDQGVTALADDLRQRGMDKDVSVVVWGEFGRTPTVNKDGGRDHWPNVSCGLLFGGGMKTGQVIGSTDRLGGQPKAPVTSRGLSCLPALHPSVRLTGTGPTPRPPGSTW